MTSIQIAKAATRLAADATIAILEAVEENGFQATDFLAPLSSPQFQEDFKLAIQDLLKKNQPQLPPSP